MTPAHSGRPLWAYVPAALITLMLAGLLTLATIAGKDPGFALEPDYYAKALRWDQEQAQRTHNARLGWRLDARLEPRSGAASTLIADLLDGAGQPVRGAKVELEAFANARSAERVYRRLRETEPGRYTVELALAYGGLWELRFDAVRGTDHFTQQLRIESGRTP